MTVQAVSGAELKVQLTGLGLTPAWFAHRLQVTTRTVIRWFHARTIPEYAALELAQLLQLANHQVREAIVNMDRGDGRSRGPYGDLNGTLRTVRTNTVQDLNTLPATWHRCITFRALWLLRNGGATVTVGYLEHSA